MDAGNGHIYRARRDLDADAFRQELAAGRPRPPLTRGRLLGVAAVFVVALATWGIVELLG